MPRYRVMHRFSGEAWEVEASFAEDARLVVGWPMGVCKIILLSKGPFAEIVPPKVAVQIRPPKRGCLPVCPDCNVTMLEKPGQEFWWHCPSCNLQYHEWDNMFFDGDGMTI